MSLSFSSVRLVFQGCVLITTTKIPHRQGFLNLIWPNGLIGLVKAGMGLANISNADFELKSQYFDLKEPFQCDFMGIWERIHAGFG